MKFTFACKKVALNDSIKDYTSQKLSKLDRYFREEADAFITFSVEKDHRCGNHGRCLPGGQSAAVHFRRSG